MSGASRPQDARGWRIALDKAAVVANRSQAAVDGGNSHETLAVTDVAVDTASGLRLHLRLGSAAERDEWMVALSRATGTAVAPSTPAAPVGRTDSAERLTGSIVRQRTTSASSTGSVRSIPSGPAPAAAASPAKAEPDSGSSLKSIFDDLRLKPR